MLSQEQEAILNFLATSEGKTECQLRFYWESLPSKNSLFEDSIALLDQQGKIMKVAIEPDCDDDDELLEWEKSDENKFLWFLSDEEFQMREALFWQ